MSSLPPPVRPSSFRSGAAVPLLVVAIGLAGCARVADDGSRVVVPAGPGQEARVLPGLEAAERRVLVVASPADVRFVERMIPHHEQALVMAALAPERATAPRLRAMAARIAGVQGPEIAVLRAWLDRQDHIVAGHGGGHPADHAGMPGMATPAQLAALGAVSGPAFDRMFLDLMTEHHRGAVAMAQDVLTTGTDVTVAEFAQDVVATQTVEIDRMRGLR